MKYKELFCYYSCCAGIVFDPQGISICRVKSLKKRIRVESVVRIVQKDLWMVEAGHSTLNLTTESIELLKNNLQGKIRSISLSIPSFCVFRHALQQDSLKEMYYILDTQSPWPMKECWFKKVCFGKQSFVFAIPLTLLEVLDSCFKHRLKLLYHRLDVQELSWMRFWSLQQRFPVQNWLHPFITQTWPLFWYAPAIGTAWNALC